MIQPPSFSANSQLILRYAALDAASAPGSVPYPDNPNPPDDPNCTELPRTFVQDKEGVFDGGYAFTGDCSDPGLQDPEGDVDGDCVVNRLDADLLLDGDCLEAGLAPNDVILEVNRIEVTNVAQITRELQRAQAGSTVFMVVWRVGPNGGQENFLTLRKR